MPSTSSSSSSSEKVQSYTTKHDNHTGRWLSTFRPTFDPKRPSSFVVGSMERPRKVEVFSVSDANSPLSLSLTAAIKAEFFASVCSRN